MRPNPRSDIEIAMNGDLSLYRVSVQVKDLPALHGCMEKLRQSAGSSGRWPHGGMDVGRWQSGRVTFDIVLSDQDLLQLKLSVNIISADWLHDWVDAKL